MGGGSRFGVVLAAAGILGMWWGLGNAFLAGDGKGLSANDCLIGLDGIAPSAVSVAGGKAMVQCTDCDPDCDADGESTPDGACTFELSACVNLPDVAGCTRAPLASATINRTSAGLRAPSPLPGDDGVACEPGTVVVTTKKRGTKVGKQLVRLKARTAGKPKRRDADVVTFVCTPRPVGEACPALETTTTTMSGITTSTLLGPTTTSTLSAGTTTTTPSESTTTTLASSTSTSSSSTSSSSTSSSSSSSSSSISTTSSTAPSTSTTSTSTSSSTSSSSTSTSTSSSSTSKTSSTSTSSSTTTSTSIPTCAPNCAAGAACLTSGNCASGLCTSGICKCPAHQFTFSVASNSGGTADPAEWTGFEISQSTSTGCSVAVDRPSDDMDVVGLLGDDFQVVGWNGFSQCTLTSCAVVSCPPLGIGSCTANRPSCSAALNGSGEAQAVVSCNQ